MLAIVSPIPTSAAPTSCAFTSRELDQIGDTRGNVETLSRMPGVGCSDDNSKASAPGRQFDGIMLIALA